MAAPLVQRRWALIVLTAIMLTGIVFTGIALTACGPRPEKANPALWEVTSPGGQHGWLFGTIHALPAPLDWRTAKISAALADAGELVVEIAALDDEATTHRIFETLSRQPGEPPLTQRVAPGLRAGLVALMAKNGLADRDFSSEKTWAAALTLADLGQAGEEAANGIDRALLTDTHLPVAELEGVGPQLALFDGLPEASQRVLLDEAVADAPHAEADAGRLAQAWARGDIAAIEHETREGPLADPTLARVLFADRNRRWAPAVARAILAGKRPFVAVGAAHMAGGEGLVALLRAAGFRVARVE